MKLEIAHYYESVYQSHPYTKRAENKIHSLGSFNNRDYIVPALIVTADYHHNEKTGLIARDVRLTFRSYGFNDAELNFPHADVKLEYNDWDDIHTFTVQLIAKYNTQATESTTWKAQGGGEIEVKKLGKINGGGGYETTTTKPKKVLSVYCEYVVKLFGKTNKLTITGHIK